MIAQALFAYFHYVSIFCLVSALVAELFLYRATMTAGEAKRLMLLDAFYGAVSLAVMASGFSRALWFAKGWDFYLHNPVFWAKVGAVAVWATLSLPPTFHYLSWRGDITRGIAPAIAPAKHAAIRRFLYAQFALVMLVPLLAVLMARGIGTSQ